MAAHLQWRWRPIDRVSIHAGVYSSGDQTYAVNRATGEDNAKFLTDTQITDLFHGLDFVRVDQSVGGIQSLAQEIWRIFLVAMMIAMAVEAGLCLPKARSQTAAPHEPTGMHRVARLTPSINIEKEKFLLSSKS